MKNCIPFILLTASALSSCNKNSLGVDGTGADYDFNSLTHQEIVLGGQLENPYSVENVKSAVQALYPTKSSISISTTDLYVRFLPKDSEQLDRLKQMGIALLDHPVDYEIVREGDWYHDPSVSSESITWQYAVVDSDFKFPADIKYELLQECYLADNDPMSKASGSDIDWAAVEAESFRLTGNEEMLCNAAGTKGSEYPSGRITIVDDKAFGGQPMGLSGVRVQCNVFIKFSSTYTDRDGYYQIPKKFSARPRYRLVFENEKGFTVGFNWIFYPASVSTLGRGDSSGLDACIDRYCDRDLFRRCVVNNSAYEYYERCSNADLGITPPPSNLCFWCFENTTSSSAIMMHHGTIMDKESSNIIVKVVSMIVEYFAPDITLGTENSEDFKSIYAKVVHEMAHASHFQQVGVEYWDAYIQYIVRCALDKVDTYGDSSRPNAGICGIGECWAYYLQNKMVKERYGGSNPAMGSSYWFHPQMFTALEERGISASAIFKAMTGDVQDIKALRERLISQNPTKKISIDQVFNRYE